MGPAAAMRAVLATALVATTMAGGTRRVGSDWPHHGVGSAPRIPIGYPLPAPRAVRSPQGRTVVVKGDAAARGNNDAPDLRPWWRRQAVATRVAPTRTARAAAAGPISRDGGLCFSGSAGAARSEAAAVSSKSSQGLPILALLELLASHSPLWYHMVPYLWYRSTPRRRPRYNS